MKYKNLFRLILSFIIISGYLFPKEINNCISLAGKWNFALDSNNVGIQQKWFERKLTQKIKLPGTTDQAGYGEKTIGSDYGVLTRVYKYVGPAWYQREIKIPKRWKNKNISLFLERVLWESQVFIDGKKINTQDALATPHIHELGILEPGKHTLTIRINNDLIYNIGDKGHAYGEYTQTIWNGIVGKIELQAKSELNFENVQIFPNMNSNEVKLDIQLSKDLEKNCLIEVDIFEKDTNKLVAQIQTTNTKIVIPIKKKVNPWNEFTPNLYLLKARLVRKKILDKYESTFGFCNVSKNESHVLINNEPIFLRGNLDCVHFPLTGYPSTDVKDWKRIFQIYKENGLNHVRYHSWCPPEAAFKAADELGIYIQAEASLWIDWWMGRTKEESRDRPEMYTKGEPKGLGEGNPNGTKFVESEINQVIDTYGNHPSFILFCIGNELGNSDFDLMGKWMKEAKERDPRRLYAASTARTVTPNCEYSATHHYPGIGGVRQYMTNHNNWNYEEKYSKTSVPTIAHEIGQWPVYPQWNEIEKYTGVLRARNLEGFKKIAIQNGISGQDIDLKNASGKLSVLLYKDEIESFMRTPSCGGIQLLSMQDYQGQGEALIGWLDCFHDSKGIISPEKIRQFHCETVPLVKMDPYIYESGDDFQVETLLFHYGIKDIVDGKIIWKVSDSDNNILIKGDFDKQNYRTGKLHNIGSINEKLPNILKSQKLTLSLEIENTKYKNEWDIWIYPKKLELNKFNDIIVTNKLDENIFKKLSDGYKVLLLANDCGTPENVKYAAWRPLYWSASFFPGQSIETIGLLLQDKHPAFANFSTENHSDWQWWNICKNAHGFILDSFPKEYKPIAQPVSDFHYNHKLGSIFEMKYGKGKLLVCGYDLSKVEFPEVRQLKYSLLNYMQSEKFNPTYKIDKQFLNKTFKKIEKVTVETPEGFENSILYVKAAGKKQENGNSPWNKIEDEILISKKVKYSVIADGIWKDNIGTSWHGRNMQINIKTPEGIKGNLFVYFHDWNNKNREGLVNFEGRDYILGDHSGKGKWIKLNVMREDTNDGKIILKTKCTKGGNLMITEMCFEPID